MAMALSFVLPSLQGVGWGLGKLSSYGMNSMKLIGDSQSYELFLFCKIKVTFGSGFLFFLFFLFFQ